MNIWKSQAGFLCPPPDGDTAVARVDADGNVRAVFGCQLFGFGGQLQGLGANDAAGNSHVPRRGYLGGRAQPAAELNRNLHGPENRFDAVPVPRLTTEGSVEINHVQKARTFVFPAPGDGRGIVAVNSHGVGPPLSQSNHLAIFQVDGGINQKWAAQSLPFPSRTKFSSIFKPTACDFSGWNCVANTFPAQSIEQNSMPYSVVPQTTDASFGLQ